VSDKKIKENKLKGLIRFHSANKINNYNREVIMVGNACGGKAGSHGSKAKLLSHAKEVKPSL